MVASLPAVRIYQTREVCARFDETTGRRRDPLVELTATHVCTHAQLSSTYFMAVYRITEGADGVPAAGDTASDKPPADPPEDDTAARAHSFPGNPRRKDQKTQRDRLGNSLSPY